MSYNTHNELTSGTLIGVTDIIVDVVKGLDELFDYREVVSKDELYSMLAARIKFAASETPGAGFIGNLAAKLLEASLKADRVKSMAGVAPDN